MKINRRIALLLVAGWLVLFGLSAVGLDLGILVPLLAIIAGVVLWLAEW